MHAGIATTFCRRNHFLRGSGEWNRMQPTVAATKIRIGRSRPSQQRKLVSDAAGRCRYGRSRRAILHRHDDCAASIRKFGPEIKNRCTKEGENGGKLAVIPKFGPEIKNRCTKEGVNGENLHRFASLALKSRIDAVFGLFPGKNLQ